MTRPIRQLDEVTASRIAAGEVVERPSSVVKELLENSLDAGARDIAVEIAAGGRRQIRVVDDGSGIPADEVELAFARHATSKIQGSDDLAAVTTLGFRGEALAAIASVAHVTMVTRTRQSATGIEMRVEDGRLVSRREVGCAAGTAVTVENLFHAVPARLKFLRSETTEAGRVQELVTAYALAHPERRFRLHRDGRTAFGSPGTGAVADSLIAAFGLDVARVMLPVLGESDGVAVVGHASPPHVHRATRRYITLFVNGRLVADPRLAYAVVDAYHTLLPQGRFPIVVLSVTLPADAVDVNVHPAKAEVRFRDGRPVFSAVGRAVRAAVAGVAPVPPLRGSYPSYGAGTAQAGAGTPRMASWPGGDDDAARAPVGPSRSIHEAPPAGRADLLPEADAASGPVPMLRVLGQVARMYIAAEGPDGLYLIDQHAAHERVVYEQLLDRGLRAHAQGLLAPETVPLTPRQAEVLREHGPAFERLGFDIEPFGPATAVVRALPDVMAAADVREAVRSVLDLTAEGEAPIDEAFEARLVRAVCKQATVKAGQTLSDAEMRSLVARLEATRSPRTCPHGRPTMIVLSNGRLRSEFGRT